MTSNHSRATTHSSLSYTCSSPPSNDIAADWSADAASVAFPSSASLSALIAERDVLPALSGIQRFLRGVVTGEALTPLVQTLSTSFTPSAETNSAAPLQHIPATTAASRRISSGFGEATEKSSPRLHKGETEEPRASSPESIPTSALRSYVTQAALLLSVEEPKANELATQLFLSSLEMTRIASHHQQRAPPAAEGSTAPPSARRITTTTARDTEDCGTRQEQRTAPRPLIAVEALPALLHPVEVSHAVRRRVREGQCGWEEGLRWLQSTALTPLTAATRIDLARHVGQWAVALESLRAMPPSYWTDIDVSGTVQALFEAGRQRHWAATGSTMKQLNPTSSPVDRSSPAEWDSCLSVLVQSASGVLRLASHHLSRWSSSSAVNSALGLFALSPSSASRKEGIDLLHAVLDNTEESVERESEMDETRPWDAAHLLPYRPLVGLQPNNVTLFHTAQLFQHHSSDWALGLSFAAELMEHHKAPVGGDLLTTELLLQLCVQGSQWQEALRLMERSNQYTEASQEYKRDKSSRLSAPQRRLRASLQEPLAALLCERCPPSRSNPVFSSASLSKYFNHNTLSRAYNTLVQHSTRLSDGEHYCNELRRLCCGVENESVAHLALLQAREGHWSRALSSFRQLLDEPARQTHYVPPAALHDAVQYALEQAPAPGAPWEVSVKLFTDATSTHQVPFSDVAFQSVVKKCFSHGASTAAQRLFEYLIRRGVHK